MTTSLLRVLCAFAVLFLSGCASPDDYSPRPSSSTVPEAPLSPQEINAEIDRSLSQGQVFNWSWTNDHVVWSASVHGDHVFSIGFGNGNLGFQRQSVQNHRDLEQQILSLISQMEGKRQEEFHIRSDAFLTTMDVVIFKKETVVALRRMSEIRYLEPSGYNYYGSSGENQAYSSSSSGCGFEFESMQFSDYGFTTPLSLVSWNYASMSIQAAWTLSSGSGVTIGVVDTGVSPVQNLLGTSFSTGLSYNRSIQKLGFFVDSFWPWSTITDGPDDLCGHGTSMIAAMGSPRTNFGLPAGIAYNSNIISCRAAKNVVLETYHEQNGVKNALVHLGNTNSVRIISMSIGHVISVGKIADGVKYAYNKGKLIVAAAGTSTSYTNFVGIIFPANMAETIAVTGVKEGLYQQCSVCHSGSKVEFTVSMERLSGSTVPVAGYYPGAGDYIGGSSVATASVSAVAALVWARYPGWSRTQVLNRMRLASYYYGAKHPQLGYGNINAWLAVQ